MESHQNDEQSKQIQANIKKALEIIRNISIQDLAEMEAMKSLGFRDALQEKVNLLLGESLEKSFPPLSLEAEQGAQELLFSEVDLIPKEEILFDHSITSKFSFFADLNLRGELGYRLTTLAIAFGGAKQEYVNNELKGIGKDIDESIIRGDNDLQQQNEKKLRETIQEEIKNKDLLTKVIKDNAFSYARERLGWYLEGVQNKSRMMRYVEGDKHGKVKTKAGEEILALNARLDEIANSKLSEEEKLKKLEQAVLDIYWQVRTDQGLFDSRLGNALENFLNSPRGLNLPLKYAPTFEIPHTAKKKTKPVIEEEGFAIDNHKMLSFLTTPINKDNSDKEFLEAYKKLIIQLSPENLKTQRRSMINQLLEELEDIRTNDGPDKLGKMRRKILDIYLTLKKQVKQERFFSQSNLADALENILKQEFKMTKKDIKLHGKTSSGIELKFIGDIDETNLSNRRKSKK